MKSDKISRETSCLWTLVSVRVYICISGGRLQRRRTAVVNLSSPGLSHCECQWEQSTTSGLTTGRQGPREDPPHRVSENGDSDWLVLAGPREPASLTCSQCCFTSAPGTTLWESFDYRWLLKMPWVNQLKLLKFLFMPCETMTSKTEVEDKEILFGTRPPKRNNCRISLPWGPIRSLNWSGGGERDVFPIAGGDWDGHREWMDAYQQPGDSFLHKRRGGKSRVYFWKEKTVEVLKSPKSHCMGMIIWEAQTTNVKAVGHCCKTQRDRYCFTLTAFLSPNKQRRFLTSLLKMGHNCEMHFSHRIRTWR